MIRTAPINPARMITTPCIFFFVVQKLLKWVVGRMLNGIKGIGVDLCKSSRVHKLYSRYPSKYLNKALHPLEIDHFHSLSDNKQRQTQYLATLWAVKEATVKATGKRLLFPDIQYTKNEISAPVIVLHNESLEWFNRTYKSIMVTVSHDDGHTIAFVLVQ